MKSKIIMKRFYCGGSKEEKKVIKTLPVVDDFSQMGIFNDSEHRKHLLEYWKQSKERQKVVTIKGDKFVENEPIIIKQSDKKVIKEEEQPKKIYSRDNLGNVIEKKEEKEQQKELPFLAQMMIKKGIESQIEKVQKNENKVQVKKKEAIEVQQGKKEFLISTAIQTLTLVYNSQGGLALLAGLYKLWESSSEMQKELAIGTGIKSVLYIIKKPWNMFCRWIGKYKWRISSGSFGSGAGLELINHLNEKGATIIPLFEGKKNYIVNNNIKEIIQEQVLKAENNGITITDNMVEQMIIQGKGVLISRNSLEPMLQDLPYETKMDIYELDIFSSEIATKHINYENIPSMIENPINAAQNVVNYTDNIINTFNASEGPIGGGFSFTNLIVGIIVIGGMIYAGIQLNNYFKASNDIISVDKGSVKGPIEGIIGGFNEVKNWIFAGFIGGGFLARVFGKEEIKKEIKEEDDSDLC